MRAANENPMLTRAFGVNVPALMTFGFGLGVALAGFAGVLAAPIYTVSPLMGADIVITYSRSSWSAASARSSARS